MPEHLKLLMLLKSMPMFGGGFRGYDSNHGRMTLFYKYTFSLPISDGNPVELLKLSIDKHFAYWDGYKISGIGKAGKKKVRELKKLMSEYKVVVEKYDVNHKFVDLTIGKRTL